MRTARLQILFCALAALPFYCSSLRAAQETFLVNASQSTVTFTLPDTIHTVHGSFRVKSGQLCVDPSSGAISGEIVVDATSGASGSHARDSRMESQILEADKFPEIKFAPTRLHGALPDQGSTKVQLDGLFTIHGASHPLSSAADVSVTGTNFRADANFDVPYVKWGMKNPSNFLLKVQDHVAINLLLVGTIKK